MQLRNSCIVIGELPASFGNFTVRNGGLIIHTYFTSTSYDVPSLVMIIHRREQTRLKFQIDKITCTQCIYTVHNNRKLEFVTLESEF